MPSIAPAFTAATRVPRVGLVDDDVAGQQQPQIGLDLERRVGELRVAGSEDHVRPAVDAELLLHRLLDVDLGDDAEALGLERCRRPAA